MIEFLAKHFIPNHTGTAGPAVRRGYGILCGCVGIGLNALLFAGKLLAGLLSGSIAITANAFNSLSGASLCQRSFRYSMKAIPGIFAGSSGNFPLDKRRRIV